ncbi:hypothetical protein [Natronosalvus rutilus]|uniref:Uncharacterized protein n=1 Tax=Natronosalvus rutilus TaxID=2953753 RepID=A0A9E7N8F1_9EURY|nr:hypothetical protein [Natronosalvus rutilus]UTF52776.1 hypothetical protein NGM29_13415 [Natronosalvus rutilus]
MHDRIPLDEMDRELTEETLTELCARRLTIEAIGNGRFRVEGCSEYENGETDPWTPLDASRIEQTP